MSIAPVSSLPTAAPAPIPAPMSVHTTAAAKPVSGPAPASASASASVSGLAPTQTANESQRLNKPDANSQGSLSQEEAKKTAEALNQQVAPMSTALTFSVDDDSGKTVIKVMDTEKNEVIRQIPSKEALALSQAMDANKGMILNTKA